MTESKNRRGNSPHAVLRIGDDTPGRLPKRYGCFATGRRCWGVVMLSGHSDKM